MIQILIETVDKEVDKQLRLQLGGGSGHSYLNGSISPFYSMLREDALPNVFPDLSLHVEFRSNTGLLDVRIPAMVSQFSNVSQRGAPDITWMP